MRKRVRILQAHRILDELGPITRRELASAMGVPVTYVYNLTKLFPDLRNRLQDERYGPKPQVPGATEALCIDALTRAIQKRLAPEPETEEESHVTDRQLPMFGKQ